MCSEDGCFELKTRTMVVGVVTRRWNNAQVPLRPRVLLVIADSSRTGGPEHVLTLAREIQRSGWQAAVVCPEGDLRDRCREAGLDSWPVSMSGRSLVAAPVRLRQLIRRYHADVIHSHGLRAGGVVRRSRIASPWVQTHHLDGWFTTGRPRFALHRHEMKAQVARANLQIAVSQSVADFLSGEAGVTKALIRVVPNGIEPLERHRLFRGGTTVVGVLASLVSSKGVDLAVMALATPQGRGLKLLVGGTGPELANLVDLAERLGVAGRTSFLGRVTDRQDFFDRCDVVWVPSRAEPFGLVACEAMSAGVPVVASRVGGLPEILDAPSAGALVAPANPAALASVTVALLSDGERYSRLSAAGAERVRQRFTAARMAALTRGVYRELLD